MAKQKTKANYIVTTEAYKDATLYHIMDSNTHSYVNNNLKLIPYIDEHTLTCKSEEEAKLITRILNKNSLASTVRMIQDIYAKQEKILCSPNTADKSDNIANNIYNSILCHFKDSAR